MLLLLLPLLHALAWALRFLLHGPACCSFCTVCTAGGRSRAEVPTLPSWRCAQLCPRPCSPTNLPATRAVPPAAACTDFLEQHPSNVDTIEAIGAVLRAAMVSVAPAANGQTDALGAGASQLSVCMASSAAVQVRWLGAMAVHRAFEYPWGPAIPRALMLASAGSLQCTCHTK